MKIRLVMSPSLGMLEESISEGVDCLFTKKIGTKGKPLIAIDFWRDEQLALLTADKEGGFVVTPQPVYEEKASEALDKNSVTFSRQKIQVKKEAANFTGRTNDLASPTKKH